ncbi:hypothetical protein [Nannocystis pusilla]|uniref:hypothetical protein n=1 Tax=Nannocystis pusilla TaxID=889268 RepID=UPI003B7F13EE
MRPSTPRLRLFGLLLCAACGPNKPADTDAEPGTTSTSTTDASPDPTTGALPPATTTTVTTEEPDPSTSTSTPTSTGTEDTMDGTAGEDITCPERQRPFTQQWSTVIEPGFDPALHHVRYQHGLAVMADHRIAVTLMAQDDFTNKFGPAVLFLSFDGGPLSVHQGELLPGTGAVFGLLRDADDSLLLTGSQSWIMGDDNPEVKWAARFAGDGTPLAHAELTGMSSFQWLMARPSAPLLLGLDDEAPIQLAKLPPGGVEPDAIEVVSVTAGRPGRWSRTPTARCWRRTAPDPGEHAGGPARPRHGR